MDNETQNVLNENESLSNIVLNASDLEIIGTTIIEKISDIISEDDQKLFLLLEQFNLEELFNTLKASKITYRSLPFLSADDIYKAIPHLGLQAEFREKLFLWRKKEYKYDDSTLSVNSKVNLWLEKASTSSEAKELSNSCLCLDVKSLLANNIAGEAIIKYYKDHSTLTDKHRDEVIRIILETVNVKQLCLKPVNFENIVDQISEVFPNENQSKCYYYVRREKNKNPRGRLYDRYKNCRSKLRKLNTPTTTKTSEKENTPSNNTEEFNDQVQYKTLLARSCDDWQEVCNYWTKSFAIRQKDVHQLESVEFMKSWPKLLDSRAVDLINIDFDLLYSNKKNLLFSKWDTFKTKLINFYDEKLRNSEYRELFLKHKTAANIDSVDYILTTLINVVIKPTARIKSGKVSVLDAQEC